MKILRELKTQQSFFRHAHTQTFVAFIKQHVDCEEILPFPSTVLLTRGDNPSVRSLYCLLRGFATWLIIPEPPPPQQLQSSDTRTNPSRHYT